jgi:hypothetical protein
LDLYGTEITDEGLPCLATLKELEWINVGGTKVTVEGVRRLGTLIKLKHVVLSADQIEKAGGATVVSKDIAPIQFMEASFRSNGQMLWYPPGLPPERKPR